MNNDFPSVFIDNDKPELVFDYTKYYDLMFNANIEINNNYIIIIDYL